MLKRRVSYLLFLLLFVGSTVTWAAGSFEDIRVYYSPIRVLLEGREILTEDTTFIYQDRIYVPLRAAAEALGYTVDWDEEAKGAALTYNTSVTIEECDPFKGEYFVYGQILSIDYVNRTINIDQHLDDNSREVYSELPLSQDAVIVLQRGSKQLSIDFADVRRGDAVSLIITKEDEIRSIIVDS